MKRKMFLLLCYAVCSILSAENPAPPWLNWNLLWTGSFSGGFTVDEDEDFNAEEIFSGGTFLNRADLNLGFPRQNISLRAQVLDRRRLPFDGSYEPVFTPGFGFYFDGGGIVGDYLDRIVILYGVLEEEGLPARTRNIWAKSVPYTDSRKSVGINLKNDISASRKPEMSLFMETPLFATEKLGNIKADVLAVFDDEFNSTLSSGIETRWNKTDNLRFDFFYTGRTLEEKKSSSWFSVSPPLPERDYCFWAIGTLFNLENFGFAFDGAYSDTFAFGKDIYANAGLRIGNKPWKFSLSADGAGSRFVDRSGAASGSGFRLAGKLERQWIRSGLLRGEVVLRSPSFGDEFNRLNLSLYYRPSSPPPKESPWFRFTRLSFSLGRDARSPGKTTDTADIGAAFNFGPLRTVFSWSINTKTVINDNPGLLLTFPFFEEFNTSKISGEVSWNPGIFSLNLKLGHTIRAGKDPLADISLNASCRFGKNGRLGFKLASPDLPQKWNYYVSYRLQM